MGLSWISRYTHWLHTRWPAGTVEKLPLAQPDGSTRVPGLYIVGDLTGVPLLKFSADTGARVVQTIRADETFARRDTSDRTVLDIAIIGGGVSGYAAAMEARKHQLHFKLFEAAEPFSTIVNFPKAKPIYTYPTQMTPSGDLQFHQKSNVKEGLLEDLYEQVQQAGIEPVIAHVDYISRSRGLLNVHLGEGKIIRAHRVVVAIGRSGNYRKLNVPGEDLPKVYNRLHDPKAFCDQKVLVVGGGDSAIEAAMAMAECGAAVTVSYRKPELSRPKPQNIDALEALMQQGKITLMLRSHIKTIQPRQVVLIDANQKEQVIPNDVVFTLIGREAPLDFFRKSKVPIAGESTAMGWGLLAFFLLLVIGIYDWKNHGFLSMWWDQWAWPEHFQGAKDRSTLWGTLSWSMRSRSFYYTLTYTFLIGFFGYRRIRRRKTPYVKWQTISLFLVQLFPLFLLPEVILPWAGYNGAFDTGLGKTIADQLFPAYISATDYAAHAWPAWGHPRAYWHAYGLILAWPLNVYNVFTPTPMAGWLIISAIQTFVLIPLLIRRFGKGAYCGWICSCGALAETMGDTQRHKMPHGPAWNRLNMIGQVFLLIALILLLLRIAGWVWPGGWLDQHFSLLLEGKNADGKLINPISYKWIVDVLWGGILGVGLYFKYSGRVWCRFACPLAALMHIYARFSQFGILADKKKCISCNVCTSVCHQGIDIMNFANRGHAMQDPQCVRCSACVQSCPTGVLTFGRVDAQGNPLAKDTLAASPVQMAELTFGATSNPHAT